MMYLTNDLFIENRRYMENVSIDFAADFYNYHNYNYIVDSMNDYADNYVDIYYDDLINWFKDNMGVPEEAYCELGFEPTTDIFEMLRVGQYYQYSRYLSDEYGSIIKYIIYKDLLDENINEIDDEILSDIGAFADDSIERFDEIEEFIEELKEKMEA